MTDTKVTPLLSHDAMVNLCEEGQLYPWQKEARKVRDFYEAARAKDAELIQRLVDGLQQIADEGHWTPDMHELLNAAAAAGFKPSND